MFAGSSVSGAVELSEGANASITNSSGRSFALTDLRFRGNLEEQTNVTFNTPASGNILLRGIQGAGALTKIGAGTLLLEGNTTFTGGTTIAAGTVNVQRAAGTVTVGDVSILKGATLSLQSATGSSIGGRIFANDIFGEGRVTKNLRSTDILVGAATHTGGTEIIDGTLQVGNGGNSGTLNGDVAIVSGSFGSGVLAFNRSDRTTFAGAASGGGQLRQDGSGTVILTGINTYTGVTTINGGTLQLGDESDDSSGTAGTLSPASTIANNGTLAFERSNELIFGNQIIGSGAVVQRGSGTLTLSNNKNTFQGGTRVESGMLRVSDSAALGNGALTLAGGTLLADGGLTINQTVQLKSDSALQVASRESATLAGAVVDGAGTTLRKTGDGTLVLAGAAQVGTLDIEAGIVKIGAAGSLAADVNNAGTLQFQRDSSLVLDGNISGSGELLLSGAGTLTLMGIVAQSSTQIASGSTLQIAATGGLSGAVVNNGVLEVARANDMTLADSISGDGTLLQTGQGILTLTGTVAQSTTTIARGSTLQLGAGSTSGSLSGAIKNDGVLVIDRSDGFDMKGDLTGGGELVQKGPGTLVLGGNVQQRLVRIGASGTVEVGIQGTLSGEVLNEGVLRFARGGNLVFADTLAGGGRLVQAGSGTLILSGNNTFSGGTTVQAGTLQIGNAVALGSGDLTLVGGTLVLAADGLSVANNVAVAGAATVRVNGADRATLSGSVSDSTETPGSLLKAGSGTLVLSGNADYLGGTTVNAGSLQVGAGGTSGWLAGDVAVAGTLAFDRSDTLDFDGALSGNGLLLQQGSGVLTLSGNSGAFAGNTAVRQGHLLLAGGRLGGEVTVVSGATLGGRGRLEGDVTIASGATLAPLEGLSVAGNLTLAHGSTVSATLVHGKDDPINVGGHLDLQGAVVDVTDGGLHEPGEYTLFTYGSLSQSQGDAGTGLSLGSGPSNLQLHTFHDENKIVLVDPTLAYWNANGLATPEQHGGGAGTWNTNAMVWTDVSGAANGLMNPTPGFAIFAGQAGEVTLDDSAGPLAVTGLQFASHGYTLNGDTLSLVDGGSWPFIRVGDGSAQAAADVARINVVLAGSAGFIKRGAGTLVLGGVNTFTGAVTVADGTLSIGSDSALGDAANAIVLDGGALQIAGTALNDTARALTLAGAGVLDIAEQAAKVHWSGVIGGAGELIKAGAGTLRLDSNHLYSGGTKLQAGTLAVGRGDALGTSDLTLAGGTLALDHEVTLGQEVHLTGVSTVSVDGTAYATLGGPLTQNSRHSVAALHKSGTGTLVLTGEATLSGPTVVEDGTLQVGAGGTQGAFTGSVDIKEPGTLAFKRSDALTFAGTLGGTGTLRQEGNGVLTLTGDQRGFTGTTKVQAGTLALHDSTLGGSTKVDSGGTLGGAGTLTGDVNVAGTLNVVDGLAMGGSLSLTPSAVLNTALGSHGQRVPLKIGGDLTVNGATLNVNNAGLGMPRLYTLLTYGGRLNQSGGGLRLGMAPTNLQLQILEDDRRVVLVDPTLQFWNANGQATANALGGGSGTWSLSAPNWTDSTGAAVGPMNPEHGTAVFGGQAGTIIIDSTAGAIQASGLQFLSDGYRLEGQSLALSSAEGTPTVWVEGANNTATISANLVGNQGLIKADSGTLVLGGSNTYTGTTTVAGGVLSVPQDSALGAVGNSVTLDGGTLQLTGTVLTDSPRAMTLTANGGTLDVADPAANVSWSGVIDGAGRLTKVGAGTLSLDIAHTYRGGTTVQAGTLAVGAAAALGSGALTLAGGTLDLVTDGLTLTQGVTLSGAGSAIHVGDARTATLAGTLTDAQSQATTLMGGAARLTKTGQGTLILSGQAHYAGGTTIEAGTLQIGDGSTHGSISGNVLNHGALVFDRMNTLTFAGVLSGGGTLAQNGPGTLILSGDSLGFTGATALNHGTLQLDGRLGGHLTVAHGAVLSGTGQLGQLTIRSGGALSPGGTGTVATLTVNGDLTFDAGSRYLIDVKPGGQSDQVNAAGQLHLQGGSALALELDGSWSQANTYTIARAEQGRTGYFEALATNLAFLDAKLSYTATEVLLNLTRNTVALADEAATRNQRSTASALEALGSDNELYRTVISLSAKQARVAFDGLSGQLHAQLRGAIAEDDRALRQTLDTQMRRNVHDSAWLTSWGNWGAHDSDGNAAAMTTSSGGVLVGAQTRHGESLRLGAVLGRSRLSARIGADEGIARAWTGALYAVADRGSLQLQAGLAYTDRHLKTTRSLSLEQLSGELIGSGNARSLQLFVEGSYRVPMSHGDWAPYVQLAHQQLRSDTLTEQAGTAASAALAVRGRSGSQSIAGLGLRSTWSWGPRDTWQLDANAAWQRRWGERTAVSWHRFERGDTDFTITGTALAKDSGLIGLSLRYKPRSAVALELGYEGGIARDQHDQSVRATLRWTF